MQQATTLRLFARDVYDYMRETGREGEKCAALDSFDFEQHQSSRRH